MTLPARTPPSGKESDASAPSRLTPLHHKHLALKAKMMDVGGWLLPQSYTSPEEELRAALNAVGLCDRSADTKVDVKGRGIDDFALKDLKLHEIPKVPGQVVAYPRRQDRSLPPIRYVCRLAREHLLVVFDGPFVLSQSSPTDAAKLATSGLDITLTNVSSVLCGLSLVGPDSVGVLRKLVKVDFSNTRGGASCLQCAIAGVQSVMVCSEIQRVGRKVGVYDLYFTRDLSEFVWDAITDAGRESAISPLGLEGHRMIRSGALPSGGQEQ